MTMALMMMTLSSIFLFSVKGEDGDIVTCGSSIKLMHIDTVISSLLFTSLL
jgi:hypothetical protein